MPTVVDEPSPASRPLLSPRVEDIAVTQPGPPMTVLSSELPAASATSVVMLFLLATWLFASPIALEYTDHAQAWSQWVSSVLVLALALVSLATRRPWLSWIAGCVGIWAMFAPSVLWSPSPAAYLSGTLTGALIATIGLVVPISRPVPGPEIPAGWRSNPSAWRRRAPVIVLAAVNVLIAAYLAAFQLGYVAWAWNPMFDAGTARVLTAVAGPGWLAAVAVAAVPLYLLALLLTCAGDRRRWRALPWLVLLYGVFIASLAVMSLVSIIAQPVTLGAWCGWCVVIALATLAMLPRVFAEVVATMQRLRAVGRAAGSWWHTLWWGDQGRTPPIDVSRPGIPSHPPWTFTSGTANAADRSTPERSARERPGPGSR